VLVVNLKPIRNDFIHMKYESMAGRHEVDINKLKRRPV